MLLDVQKVTVNCSRTVKNKTMQISYNFIYLEKGPVRAYYGESIKINYAFGVHRQQTGPLYTQPQPW